jgi:hypothetical protein
MLIIFSCSGVGDLFEVFLIGKNVTSVPKEAGKDKHSESEKGSNDGAATISNFSLLFLDGKLLGEDYFLVEHG